MSYLSNFQIDDDELKFDIHNLNLKLDNVSIDNRLLESEERISVCNQILFRLGYFCELELDKCQIEFETELDNTFLF